MEEIFMSAEELQRLKDTAKVNVVENILVSKGIVSQAEFTSEVNRFIKSQVSEEEYEELDKSNLL
jgi:hypothetical protein